MVLGMIGCVVLDHISLSQGSNRQSYFDQVARASSIPTASVSILARGISTQTVSLAKALEPQPIFSNCIRRVLHSTKTGCDVCYIPEGVIPVTPVLKL